jgi:hypothetical protein
MRPRAFRASDDLLLAMYLRTPYAPRRARMPTIATTIMSSINVNPPGRVRVGLFLLRVLGTILSH